MSTELKFPKTYKSSSAAYRAIRHFEEKNGKKDFIMEKIEKGIFQVSVGTNKISIEDFVKDTQNVQYGQTTYRHFPDGVHGQGYYELKKGDRRRPNSLFKTTEEVYQDING